MSDKFCTSRRNFLKALGLASVGVASWAVLKHLKTHSTLPITFSGISPHTAHQIRHTAFPEPTQCDTQKIVIIGSGIAGLSAARYLSQHGQSDFTILELESSFGGNAAWGSNHVSSFPIAAHYLPVLTQESDFLMEFLQEANVITGFDAKGQPYYNEMYLCHDAKERLYINGTWQNGFIPTVGLLEQDEAEFEKFFKLMDYYQFLRGEDGKFVFCIPIAMGSPDKRYQALDQITMADFLKENHFQSSYLLWYVNYCCRDDYGAGIDVISAWAGIHYFAARRTTSANADADAILTWPEGNGFLAQKLAQHYLSQIKTQALVYAVKPYNHGYEVQYFDLAQQKSYAIRTPCVIMATPRFIAQKLCAPHFSDCFTQVNTWEYSPWLIANISLDNTKNNKTIMNDFAWDNASYYSRSLGYIDATHQSLQSHHAQRVVTYYLPLDELPAQEARKQALGLSTEHWKKLIIADLEKMHPGIQKNIQDIELRLLGHAMIRPIPGQISSASIIPRAHQGLFFAHSDMSGISIFEEAFWQGMETAKAVNTYLTSL